MNLRNIFKQSKSIQFVSASTSRVVLKGRTGCGDKLTSLSRTARRVPLLRVLTTTVLMLWHQCLSRTAIATAPDVPVAINNKSRINWQATVYRNGAKKRSRPTVGLVAVSRRRSNVPVLLHHIYNRRAPWTRMHFGETAKSEVVCFSSSFTSILFRPYGEMD